MRVSAFIIMVLLASCTNKTNEDYRGFTKRTLTLVDSLGEIELMLPDYYDTLHSWVKMSDYHCGDERYYRFQPTKYPMGQEKGIFSKFDSVSDELTISHVSHLECVIPIDTLTCNPYIPFEIDTLFQFESNGRQFCYFSFIQQIHKRPDDNPIPEWYYAPVQCVWANVLLNDLHLQFQFRELNSEYDKGNFQEQCLKILKSIKITGNGVVAKR